MTYLPSRKTLLSQLPTATTQPIDKPTKSWDVLAAKFQDPQTIGLAVACLGLYAWSKHRKTKTGLLGKGGLGKVAVLERARKRGLEEVGTTIGNTPIWIGNPAKSGSIMLRKVCPGVLVEGGPGSGKTFSFFNSAMFSVLQQRLGSVMVDFKYPKQTSRVIDYAKSRMGYEISLIAPSFEETQVLNPIKLLRDESDAVRAEEFIKVCKANLSKGATLSSADKFWDDSANSVLTGLFCWAYMLKYPDLLMIKSILGLSDLPTRIRAIKDDLPAVVYSLFDPLFAAEGSDKQLAGLIASCQQPINSMTNSAFLSSICGDTTAPLEIGEGQMLIFGFNRKYKKTLAPLLSALIHTVIENNINTQRDSPLAFFCDELPGLYLPDIDQWLAEGREDGFMGLLGIQAHSQMVKRYGKEATDTIYTSTPSKVLMNPNNPERAEGMSKWVGQVDVDFETKGDGTSKQGKSKNYSGHKQAVNELQAAQITRLVQGEGIWISPGFQSANGSQSFVPVKKKVNVDKAIIESMDYSVKQWNEIIRPELKAENMSRVYGDAEFLERRLYAEKLLPLPVFDDDGYAD